MPIPRKKNERRHKGNSSENGGLGPVGAEGREPYRERNLQGPKSFKREELGEVAQEKGKVMVLFSKERHLSENTQTETKK